jgi:transcription elongation GreA/GreB family factor
MDERSRHDRTVRLLEARLEALAVASERSPRGERRFDREIVAAVAATRHAVELELISTEEAASIWATVAGRHPHAAWCRVGPRLAA